MSCQILLTIAVVFTPFQLVNSKENYENIQHQGFMQDQTQGRVNTQIVNGVGTSRTTGFQ